MSKKIIISIIIIILALILIGFIKKIKAPKETPPPEIPKPPITKEYGPGDYDFSLVHDGLTRKYKAHIPAAYNKASKTSLVIFIHGGGGSSQGSKNDGLYSYSDKYGFILLSPAGTGILEDRLLVWNCGQWSAGGTIQTCAGYANQNNIDDIGFISKMIDEAKKNFNVDENKIYATGISQGGLMSYRLACELSNKIAAVAPVAPPAIPINCTPSRPVPVMHIHGTADPCAPYNGGMSGGCLGSKPQPMQSATEMVNRWKNLNKCSADSKIIYQKGNATCIGYNKCADNSEVEFCTVKGMGHTYPSGSQYLPANIVGPVSYDISFDQIWDFFKKHSIK